MAVTCFFNFDDGQFHFKISKDNLYFSSLVSLLKGKYYCDYSSSTYTWSTKSSLNAQAIIQDISAYDNVEISQDDKFLLEDFTYPEDDNFKRVKISPDKDLITMFPPLLGKEPNVHFQLEAIKAGLIQNRIIYDIDMGHGKSYIFSMVLGTLLKKGFVDKCLIVCRLEGMENLRLELLRFLGSIITSDDIGMCYTNNREIEDLFDKKIIITNYITFRLTGSYYSKKVFKSTAKKPEKKAIKFSAWGEHRMLLLDESQEINNFSSIQSHFVHTYGEDFERIISMSGSLGYKFVHYFSHCKLLLPQSLKYSFTEWTNYVAIKGNYYSDTAITDFKEDKVKEFKEKIIDKLQVTYRDCLELPELIVDKIYIKMTPKLKDIYQKFVDREINERKKAKGEKITGKVLKNFFPHLALVVSDPILLNTDDIKNWSIKDSPKLQVLESLIEKYIEEKRKIVVWSNHPKILNTLAEYFSKYKPYVIHGDIKASIKKQDRHSEVEDFKKSKTRNILFASYVLSTSMNITQATRQIYWDLPLDSDDFVQSPKRLHRQGQTESVISHYLLYNNSLDIYIWEEILEPKSNVKESLSSKENLTLEDYRDVLNRSKESYLTFKG